MLCFVGAVILRSMLTEEQFKLLTMTTPEEANEAWRESLTGLDEEFDEPIRNTAEALAFLGSSCDPWLAACAIFAGGEADVPLARTIVGGVIAATLLPKFVVPCLYVMMKRKPAATELEPGWA